MLPSLINCYLCLIFFRKQVTIDIELGNPQVAASTNEITGLMQAKVKFKVNLIIT